MAPKSERGDGLDFVGPYASTQQGILVRAEDAEQYQRMSDFNGKLVCVWKGTTSAAELKREAYGKIGLAVETDARTCVRRLREKTVDAVSTDQLILYGFMEEESGFAVVHSLTFGAFNDYGIAMVKGHREHCRKLQDALMEYARSNDWGPDFQNDLPKVPKAIRDEARPTEDDIDRYSFRDRPGNVQAAD